MRASSIKKGQKFQHTNKPFEALSSAQMCKHENPDNYEYVCLKVKRTDTGKTIKHYLLQADAGVREL